MASQVSDNKYFECPAKMSDGRQFTDYRPRCFQTEDYTVGCKQLNSYEYRQYLISHGQNMIDQNRNLAYEVNKCPTCQYMVNENDTMVPEKNIQVCNTSVCKIVPYNEIGIGNGRWYNDVGSVV